MKFRCAGYETESIVDGPGLRLVIFFQGCLRHCKGCHNPETWSLNGGQEMDTSYFEALMDNPLLAGITLSGGEPWYQAEQALELAKMAKKRNLSVWCYTGAHVEDIEAIIEYTGCGMYEEGAGDVVLARQYYIFKDLYETIDVLVDGEFREEEKSLDLEWRGSKNQRVIDMNERRKNK